MSLTEPISMADDSPSDHLGQEPKINTELWFTELLCSRLCHDVISPVGAVSNGLELMADLGDSRDGDAMALVASSARQAVEKLSFFRVAYGQAGMRQSGISFGEAAGLLEPMVTSPRVALDWPKDQRPTGIPLAPGGIKLALNIGLLSVEALPRGGNLRVSVTPEGSNVNFAILAAAADARFTEELSLALGGDVPVPELTAKSAQAALTRLLADRLGTTVIVDEQNSPETGVMFSALLPIDA